MRVVIVLDSSRSRHFLILRILRYRFGNLVAGLDGSIVFQHVEDKALVDSLTHRIMMEGIIVSVSLHHTKGLQRLRLGRSGKSIEIEVLVLALRQQRFRHHIHAVFQLLFRLLFPCRHLAQRLVSIGQRLFQFLCTLTALRTMCLVYHDGKVLLGVSVQFFIDERETMNRRDNDALLVVDGILQFRRVVIVGDSLYLSQLMIKAQDGVLQLIIQYPSIRHHKHRLEHLFVFHVMQRCQPIGKPCYGVRLAAACTMLQQPTLTLLLGFRISNQFFYHIQLMITWEDNLP